MRMRMSESHRRSSALHGASWLCLAGALLFTLRFDYFLLGVGGAEARAIYPASAVLMLHAVETTLVVAVAFFFLLAVSRRRLVVPAIVVLFALCDVPAYFTRKYQTSVRVAVESVLDWSDREDIFVFGWRWLLSLAIALVAAVLLGAAIRVWGARPRARLHLFPPALVGLAAIAALVVDATQFDGRVRAKVWLDYLPLALVSQTWNYVAATRAYANKVDISRKDYTLQEANRDLVFVFVIGESVRAKNFSLNGYARQTNPELARVANLVSFTNVSSAATQTRKSVPVILTRVTAAAARPLMTAGGWEHDVYITETSFISIFNRLGFATSFLANWTQFGIWSTSETIIAEEAAFTYFPSSHALSEDERAARLRLLGVRDVARFDRNYDENLLFILDHRLDTGAPRSLVVMHPYGSHFQYVTYPKEFERFTPVCEFHAANFELERCGAKLVNSYDNTILYADWLLAQIIQRLASRNAVLLYVGDHAESLGEQGYYIHSHDVEWEKHVPLIVWASERYLADPVNRSKFEALRANKDRPVTHDFIFHTTLDLAGIASAEVLRPELSLCRPAL
jgi:glucan phosphoethanolaminetransferase (alkaline phosphatase superfamily)